MKLLKVEEHNYHIVYINNNEKYDAYRRVNEITWEKYNNGRWYAVEDCIELEKVFNQRDKTKTYKV